jgi:hypothetical protein
VRLMMQHARSSSDEQAEDGARGRAADTAEEP